MGKGSAGEEGDGGAFPFPTEPFSALKKTEESTKRKLSAAMDWKRNKKKKGERGRYLYDVRNGRGRGYPNKVAKWV